MKKNEKETTITIPKIKRGRMTLQIVGMRPIIFNRIPDNAKEEFLVPAGAKTAGARKTKLKHHPYDEFAGSPYILPKGNPTLIAIMSAAFKSAMRTATTDIEGASKAAIGRLVYVENEMVPIYGIPELRMDIVRQAGMNRTPDVRTRACIRSWACEVTISYVEPNINATTIVNLLSAAGMTAGVGDWRPEKGAGDYGQFMIVSKTDKLYKDIVKNGGRKAQEKAMKNPECYNEETRRLYDWAMEEIKTKHSQKVA